MAYGGYGRLRVLVVDDFDSFRMTISKILHDFGVELVDTVANGQDAIKQCASKRYDLVLCDYNLGPGKTGQQVLEELRHRQILGADSLFALVSAESSKSIVLAAYDSAPDAYLTKPITARTLQQRLDRLLAERDEMRSIHKSLGQDNKSEAIDECKRKISGQSRYASSCQKLLAQLYIDTDQPAEAEVIYRQVLEVRQLDWARLGLAKVKQLKGELQQSSEWLRSIIQANPMCMPAYDLLAENCRLENNDQELQQVLQQAVTVSPMALMRQQSLAQTASDNNDLVVAANSYKRAVRLGQNSCFDDVAVHLEFGRTTAELFSENPEEVKDLARDALRTLEQVNKKFSPLRNVDMQSALIGVQIYAHQGDAARSSSLLQELEDKVQQDEWKMDLDTSIDYSQALVATGQSDKGKQVIESLIAEYKDDQEAMNKIDQLLDEPASDENRRQIAQINKQGIHFYEQSNFSEAIELFQCARRMFPNHIGVQLNLVQALLGEMREYGLESEPMELCITVLAKVEKSVDAQHPQMRRYRQLQEMMKTIERESKKS